MTVLDCPQLVRNNEDSSTHKSGPDEVHHTRCRLAVHTGGDFVENDHGGFTEEHPREAKELVLPTRQG